MFDHKRAALACQFIQLLTFTQGTFAGKPFRLQPWQHDVISQFYGTTAQDDDGTLIRQYQYLYLEIPKKNGKTELSAALGLYHLLADGEANGEIYICAADRENASKCFQAMRAMVEAAPWLQKRVEVRPSTKEIRLKKDLSFIKVLSSEAYSKHGKNISCVIFDELHAQPNRALWDVMTAGAGDARRQPVWIVLTTAGDDPDRKSIGWEIHSMCRRILAARDGTGNPADDNPIWLPVIYGLPDDAEAADKLDIYDEALWRQCNPSIGVTIPLRAVRQAALEAKQSEAKERLFRWLRLNQWIAVKTVGWLPLTLYDRTQWHVPALDAQGLSGPSLRQAMRETLRGKRCYGGLDLSSTTDLSAFVLEFPPQPGLNHWVVLFWAWRPRIGVEDAENRDHVPYRDWERAGYLTLCEGDMVDFGEIESTILEASRCYNLVQLGVDPYLSRMMSGRLIAAGLNVVEIWQNYRGLSAAMKDIEVRLRGHEMVHEHNTCARTCFGNTRCKVDENENIKPVKIQSIGRIDIAVAWIMAHATAMLNPGDTLGEQIAAGEWHM